MPRWALVICSCRLLRRAGRAAALAEVEPSIEVALGAKRRAEDMTMVVCDQLRSEEMTIDGLSMVGWGDERLFLRCGGGVKSEEAQWKGELIGHYIS